MLPNQGETINVASVMGRRFGIGDGSFCTWFQWQNEGTSHWW